ncbi:MAG TPA: response regulator [Tepidisphaeraceae bacterium]|nr:response regulator [Tepidisphaeraceae bacterium]
MEEAKGCVLLVEDDEMTRKAMVRLLRMAGLIVLAASSVAEACRMLAAAAPPPDCLLVDLQLPDGCGSDVIAEARRARLAGKVVILSGSLLPPEAVGIETRVGADAIFMKPVNPRDVLEWVRAHCVCEPIPSAAHA